VKHLIVNATTGEQTETVFPTSELEKLEAFETEAAWSNLRQRRNALLAECDWTVLSDSPTSTAAWKTYRQALRDLPATTTDPTAPDWPTPPS